MSAGRKQRRVLRVAQRSAGVLRYELPAPCAERLPRIVATRIGVEGRPEAEGERSARVGHAPRCVGKARTRWQVPRNHIEKNGRRRENVLHEIICVPPTVCRCPAVTS